MKSKYALAKKTPEEVKKIAQYFINPSFSRPMDESLIDWSEDVPEVQSSPVPHVSPAGEHVPLLQFLPIPRVSPAGKHVPLPHVPRAESSNSGPSALNYSNNQPTIASSWDGAPHALSIFGTKETSASDTANMFQLITRMIDFFKNNLADRVPLAGEFTDVVKAL